MLTDKRWELTILDADLPASELDCLAAGDLDGDGDVEIVAGGVSESSALVWYRPATGEKGVIAPSGSFHVGMALEDIDGDGLLEVVVGEERERGANNWRLVWFKPQKDLRAPWVRHVLDPVFEGGPHDIVFADVDGDGRRELVVIACYTNTPGIYLFRRPFDPARQWPKYAVSEGIFTEGLSIGDVDGDGILEIVCGPDLYTQPLGGPYAGLWKRCVYAPAFREMCRTQLMDITGDGTLDILITDSEYMDGYFSWYENRMKADPEQPFIEHRMEENLVYCHTLEARRAPDGSIRVFLAEMEQGGWDAPYNYNARLIEYTVRNGGATWERSVLHRDDGVCGGVVADLDSDGDLEVAGKSLGRTWHNPKVQVWDRAKTASPLTEFEHTLIDRDKPVTGVDIHAVDIDGDGLDDIVCANLWYRNPDWKRFTIPGIVQVLTACDIDGDGRQELIALEEPAQLRANFYENLSSRLCWLKPVDPARGKWEKHTIGTGRGDWPHGVLVAPVLPGGKLALLTAYHSCNAGAADYPELFEIPDDPCKGPWPKRTLAEIVYGEEFLTADLTGNGLLDIVAGSWWLENLGNGQFKPWKFAEGCVPARVRLMDVNGNGRMDIVMAQEVADWGKRIIGWSGLLWFENPGDPRQVPWKKHTVDTLRCVHSLDVADLDGDGKPEIVCAEHDPFWPYRSRCRLLAYKQADPAGRSWKKFELDGRFEHHDGAKVFRIAPGRQAIVSHGWQDSIYVHLWERKKP